MSKRKNTVPTFPSVSVTVGNGCLPVEVTLIAQLGHGSGDSMYASALARQKAHDTFVDALDEPSARLGSTSFEHGDATALHSFAVGAGGHPFHRHAGHRMFTAVSGSGGAQLRFSGASPEQVDRDPQSFIDALRIINIPPDSLFTVRFGGGVWHQFVPSSTSGLHPAFFALSCHTNELGGDLPDAVRQEVLAGKASVPSLTMLLPLKTADLVTDILISQIKVPTIDLSLDAPPGTLRRFLCKYIRGSIGLVRGKWSGYLRSTGFLVRTGGDYAVTELKNLPTGSLLHWELTDKSFHYEDTFCVSLDGKNVGHASAKNLLSRVLNGFLNNPPSGVSRMMAFRNWAVKPIGLRSSPLGCPVSSLLSPRTCNLFDSRYPVLDQSIQCDSRAQVILGANDKHLIFRSCVGVQIINVDRVDITIGTRVRCENLFGHFYMALIDYVHRHYVTPTMLRMAVEHAFPEVEMATARHQPLASSQSYSG
jgi:hypothetical protein